VPELLEALERHHEPVAGSAVREKLLRMSAATMDRRLQRARSRRGGRGRTTTKPGSLLKQAIPIRTFADWDQAQPGFLEMDLVAHCGQTTAGEYLHTLSAVDVDTRWFLPPSDRSATTPGGQPSQTVEAPSLRFTDEATNPPSVRSFNEAIRRAKPSVVRGQPSAISPRTLCRNRKRKTQNRTPAP